MMLRLPISLECQQHYGLAAATADQLTSSRTSCSTTPKYGLMCWINCLQPAHGHSSKTWHSPTSDWVRLTSQNYTVRYRNRMQRVLFNKAIKLQSVVHGANVIADDGYWSLNVKTRNLGSCNSCARNILPFLLLDVHAHAARPTCNVVHS